MKIFRALVLTTIPVLVGTLAFISPNQINAANPSARIAQATDAPNPPDRQHKPPKIDFAAAASKLGVTEAQLKDALGVPANPPNLSDRNQRPPRPDFNDAAKKLGVTEQQLTAALGIPPHPPDGDRPAPLPNR